MLDTILKNSYDNCVYLSHSLSGQAPSHLHCLMCQKVLPEQEGNESKALSLKTRKKVLLPSFESLDTCKHIEKKLCNIHLSMNWQMNEQLSQEVSEEQAGSGRSEFVFSSGLSLPIDAGLIAGGYEHTSDRANGHNENGLNEYVQHAYFDRQEEGRRSAEVRNDRAISTSNNTPPRHPVQHAHFGRQEEGRRSAEVRNDRAISTSNSTPPRHPDYVEYSDRLRTYARWTHRRPDPHSLTKAGFFYTNNADLVRCYQCGIGLKDFCEEDDPLKEHVRHSGNCPYLLQCLEARQLAELKGQLQREDPEYNRQRQWNERRALDPTTTSYRHPEYQTLQTRLSSFTSWPAHMTQTPLQLAEAGLYYTGFEDRVRCFACDGGLQRWDPDDDPWTEHCRWFPACQFARQQKGDEYIAVVQAAVAFENQGNAEQSGGQGISSALEQMALRDPAFRAAINEHKNACVEMGYQLEDVNESVQELRDRGSIKPTIEEIIDVIEVIKTRRAQEEALQAIQNETPGEENQRLKKFIMCMMCGRNNVNVLFLPCTHHRLCTECAESLTNCPVCDKVIRQKIRTYMA